MSERTASRLAWALGSLSWVFGIGFLLALPAAPGFRASDSLFQAGTALTGVAFGSVGIVIATRQRSNRIGWIFLAIGVSMSLTALVQTYVGTPTPAARARPGYTYADWATNWVWLPAYFLAFSVLFLLFPDGRPPSPRWRPVERGVWIVLGVGLIAVMLHPNPGGEAGFRNPIVDLSSIRQLLDAILALTTVIGLGAGLVLSVAGLVMRYRHADLIMREQLKWFIYATVATMILLPTRSILASDHPVLALIGLLSALLLPGASLIAILKYRLLDIDVVIRKTLIYTVMVTLLIAVFSGLTWSATQVFSSATDNRFRLIAGILVGALIWPLRSLSTQIANRLVFGRRATPYQVLSEFAERVGTTYSDADVTARMAKLVSDATGAAVSRVWLRDADGLHVVASVPVDEGNARWPDEGIEVHYQGKPLGGISVDMPANDPLDATRERLLRDLAGQAGPVLANVRLIEELRASRRRIVAAQDERAKKLERDLHDGAQQQLVALAIKQHLAAGLVGKDDERAKELLGQLAVDTNDALQNLRDLARGIYPPLLADKGLGVALATQSRKSPIPVAVESEGIGRYPQEVEAAVYFCCLEALQNVAKYAEASAATVLLSEGSGVLSLEVADDGRGFDAAATSYGTGLQGMADRLDALGGSLEVRSTPGQGTRILGQVPGLRMTE